MYLASKEYHQQLDRYLQGAESNELDMRLLNTFIRYYLRMSSRCTPFGLFAGVMAGKISTTTDLRIKDKEKHELHLKPDLAWLLRKINDLTGQPGVRAKIIWYPNSTLYKLGEQVRYYQSVLKPDGKRAYKLIELTCDTPLEEVLSFAKPGRYLAELIEFTRRFADDPDQIHSYLEELFGSQVLVSELEPILVGAPAGIHFLQTIKQRLPDHTVTQWFEERPEFLQASTTPAQVDKITFPVRADMHVTGKSIQLSKQWTNQILLGIRLCRALQSDSLQDPLRHFKVAFAKRYGQREIPLTLALDPESGVGLDPDDSPDLVESVPWIDDLVIRPQTDISVRDQHTWSDADGRWPGSSDEWYFWPESDCKKVLSIDQGTWPKQLYAIVEISGGLGTTSPEIHLRATGEGNPAHLLSRFALPEGTEVSEYWEEMVAQQKADKQSGVEADISHLPGDSVGNILQRPHGAEYEIPIANGSLKETEYQIHISDLMVSVRDDQVFLRSKRLNKPVIPRLLNAHNTESSPLTVYRFLTRVASMKPYSVSGYGNSWLKDRSGFIRGWRYRNLILRCPVWQFDRSDIQAVIEPLKEGDPTCLQKWLDRVGMPEQVLWMDGEQDLFLDWSNVTLVLALWSQLHRRPLLRFRPWPYTLGSPVRSGDSYQANQFLISYYRS